MQIEDVVKITKMLPTAELAEKLRPLLKKPVSIAELSSRFDRGEKQIKSALEHLRASGFHISVKGAEATILHDLPVGGDVRINPMLYKGREYRFGIVTDNHLASKYSRLDVLNAAYDAFEEEGIKDVFHGGNMIDGRCRFNQFDLLPGCESMEGQIAYAGKHYPRKKGITTHFIVGDDHEGWWAQREGVDVGRLMQSRFEDGGRDDLKYIGYLEADIKISAPKGKTWIKVIHPGGGSTYAISYVSQKLVESFQGGEKPAILIIAHHHKFDFCMPREVFCIQAGCTEDQTPFMRKNKIQAHVGFTICRATLAPGGHVSALSVDFRRFFDRGFYSGRERFPRW